MGKILYMGYNGYGHVNPSLSLVKSLVDNGNEVIYLNSKEFKNIIEQTGAKYVRNRFLDLLYEIADMESVKMEKMTEEEYFCGVENFYGQLGNILKILLELKKVIVSMNPDLILYDSSAKIVGYFCSDLKIPRVCVFTFFATNLSIGRKYRLAFRYLFQLAVESLHGVHCVNQPPDCFRILEIGGQSCPVFKP